MEKVLDLDAPVHPGAVPGLSLGTLLQYSPIIQELVQAVEVATAGGSTQVPVIRFKVHGRHIAIGPAPVVVEP